MTEIVLSAEARLTAGSSTQGALSLMAGVVALGIGVLTAS
jgi:hypothetical protein